MATFDIGGEVKNDTHSELELAGYELEN